MLKQISFIKSAYNLSQVPVLKLPQLILCGRSNVGKSSFINSLFNRNKLAKTSSTPGKTRSINFFNVDNKFYIVDLPGFGYAKAGKLERERWGKLVTDYIRNTSEILHAFHLIDCRYAPTELDLNLYHWLQSASIESSIILSKIDKLSRSELLRAITKVKNRFPGFVPDKNLLSYSSIESRWKDSIRKKIIDLFY